MATTPTQLPVPSEDLRDLKFNSGKIDEFVTSDETEYTDRFGNTHYTIAGLDQLIKDTIAEYGYVPVNSFEDGATLTLPNQVLLLKSTGVYYRWLGDFPKVVPPNSTPEDTGGTGIGGWLLLGDVTIRSELASSTGATIIGYNDTTVSAALDELKNSSGVTSVNGKTGEVTLSAADVGATTQEYVNQSIAQGFSTESISVAQNLTVAGHNVVLSVNGLGADESGTIELVALPPLEFGVVGTDVFATRIGAKTIINPGSTIAGSELYPACIVYDSRSFAISVQNYNITLAGTWLCVGYSYGGSDNQYNYKTPTLFRRIA